MRKVIYHPDVQPEVVAAAAYYEQQRECLGKRFLEEFDRAIADIRQHPETWPKSKYGCRQHQVRHFPYGIIYKVYADTARVLALMHLHKHPAYWKERMVCITSKGQQAKMRGRADA